MKKNHRYYERKRQTLRKRAEQRWKRAPKTESASRTHMSYLSVRESRRYEEYGKKWFALKFGSNILPPSGNPKKLNETDMPVPPLKDTPGTWEYRNIRAVDTHTEVTYAYCQAGHLHCYHNGEIVKRQRDKSVSKHITLTEDYSLDDSNSLGWKDKTVVRTDFCG